ncbi:MAG TPA: hypothetical protein VNZ86_07060 [Bacteroidia bacterium]|jgi:hypothetical protein|nr:hypothetical protein [Bacteroidia bacterium]
MLQRPNTRIVFICLLGILLLFTPGLFAQGCSQCKMIPQSDLQNGGNVAAGINKGILYMMALPYIILFLLFRKQIVGFYRQMRTRK